MCIYIILYIYIYVCYVYAVYTYYICIYIHILDLYIHTHINSNNLYVYKLFKNILWAFGSGLDGFASFSVQFRVVDMSKYHFYVCVTPIFAFRRKSSENEHACLFSFSHEIGFRESKNTLNICPGRFRNSSKRALKVN